MNFCTNNSNNTCKGILNKKAFFIILFIIHFCYPVFSQTNATAVLSIQLMLNNNGGSNNIADGVTAIFGPNYSAIVGYEDARKITNLDENLAIRRTGVDLVVEARPLISNADTLPLKIWKFRQNSYLFKVKGSNFSSLLEGVIKDAYLNIDYPIALSDTTNIPFVLTADSASFASNRFCVVFRTANNLLPVSLTNFNASCTANGIQLNWNAQSESNLISYEIEHSTSGNNFNKVGSVVPKGTNAVVQSYTWFDQAPVYGSNLYRIKVTEASGAEKYSSVVKVSNSNQSPGIIIYPNPIQGSLLRMQMISMKKGNYAISLYNTFGQLVYSSALKHNGSTSAIVFNINKNISTGIYTLRIKGEAVDATKSVIFR